MVDVRTDELLVAFQDYFSAEIDHDNSISIVLFVLGTLSIPVLWFWLLRPVFNKVHSVFSSLRSTVPSLSLGSLSLLFCSLFDSEDFLLFLFF